MDKPLVSVIIPTYNAENYVAEAIGSALAQTYESIEIVVVDDGSTDGTRKVLENYIRDAKIIYRYQENKGLAAARNTGIKNSHGEYVALLDADDVFLPTKIEKQVDYLEKHPECGISYCDVYHFWDGEPEKLLKLDYRYYSGNEVLPNLLKRHFIAPLAMLVRRKIFDRFGLFDENFRRSEDLEFLVRVCYAGVRICFLNEVLGKLRLRRTSNLQGFESQPEVKLTGLTVFENLNQKLTPSERQTLKMKKHLSLYRLKAAFAYLENGNKKEAGKLLKEAFRDFRAGPILGFFLRSFIAVIPTRLLVAVFRYYHIRKQSSLLKKLRPAGNGEPR